MTHKDQSGKNKLDRTQSDTPTLGKDLSNMTEHDADQHQDGQDYIDLPFSASVEKAIIDFSEYSEPMASKTAAVYQLLEKEQLSKKQMSNLLTATLMLDAPAAFNMVEHFGEHVAKIHTDLHYFINLAEHPPSDASFPKLSRVAAMGYMAIVLADSNEFLDYYESTQEYARTAAPESTSSAFAGLSDLEKLEEYGYHEDYVGHHAPSASDEGYSEIFNNSPDPSSNQVSSYSVGVILKGMLKVAQHDTKKCSVTLKQAFSEAFNRMSFAADDSRSMSLNERTNKFIIQNPTLSGQAKPPMQ